MDFGIASVAGVTAIGYLAGMWCKSSERVKDENIPTVCATVGGVFGIIGLYVMPDFPAADVINAAAVGIVSGLAATGLNQIKKQLGK